MTIIKSPDNGLPSISVVGICRRCRHYHQIEERTDHFGRAAFDWEFKHRSCELEEPGSVEFLSPRRFIPKGFDDEVYQVAGQAPWWLDWKANADVKIAYAADAQLTFAINSLGTSATLVAGYESSSVDNSSNKYLDYEITGKATTGTSPTVDKELRLSGVRPINDTPTWPDVFDGTASAETVASTYILAGLPIFWSSSNSATSDITYPIVNALTVAAAYSICPSLFSFFFSHNTGVNLNATGGNHELSVRGLYATTI